MSWKDVYCIETGNGYTWMICYSHNKKIAFHIQFNSWGEAAAHAAARFYYENEKINKILLD